MSDSRCASVGAAGDPARISISAVLASVLGRPGTLWKTFLAFLLWFATAAVPWVNLGTTLGLFAVARDVARGRPVSPIDVFDPAHRSRIVPALEAFGLPLAALAGAAALGAVAAFQTGLFFAAFPGWTVCGAAVPCPCFTLAPWQRFAALAVSAGGLVPVLAAAASWAFSVPVFLDTGKTGAEAMRRSRELVSGNLVAVLVLLLVPAVVALAVPLAVAACGASVLSVFAGEAVAATLGIAVYGRTYGALLEARGAGGSGKEA